jgi:hypothetical protein
VSKAREAQRLGAKAIVVGGDDPHKSGNRDIAITMLAKGVCFETRSTDSSTQPIV